MIFLLILSAGNLASLAGGVVVPDKTRMKFIVGNQVQDLKTVRLPGLDKPFEKLTISELVQLRPGSEVADSYDVNAVTDNISVSTSSMLAELGQIQKINAMQKVVNQSRLNELRTTLVPGRLIAGRSAEAATPQSVELPDPTEDVFRPDAPDDPFKV
jgi:hypothetical protein